MSRREATIATVRANKLIGRTSGILLHPTSLPGSPALGDLGADADRFLDWVAAAGATFWQVLPLGPTGSSRSPYASPSSFAGNPLLISPEELHRDGLLDVSSLRDRPRGRVAFARVAAWKEGVLRESWTRFAHDGPAAVRLAFDAFVEDPLQAVWLEDWTLYRALQERFGPRSWIRWDPDLRQRRPAALAAATRELSDSMAYHRWVQFLFSRQWQRVRAEAARRGLRILGDVPIYPSLDSADVWANPDYFNLDSRGRPVTVAGVPPDYFSATGQLWGNPLYRWELLEQDGFRWWIDRIRVNLGLVDLVRLDHFRGYVDYWEVPASEKTAIRGRWLPGPGRKLFDAARAALGGLPFIAEDLGEITVGVGKLKDELGLPGMKVLQFGFEEPDSTHLPHLYGPGDVAYTGTHDNDTARGWFGKLDAPRKREVLDYLGSNGRDVAWDMIRAVHDSAAGLAVVPMQDVLGLDGRSRMNTPGRARGNWSWRVARRQLGQARAARLHDLARRTGRL